MKSEVAAVNAIQTVSGLMMLLKREYVLSKA